MTKEQLFKGQEINSEIRRLEEQKDSILKCLRTLELDNYVLDTSRLDVQGKNCIVDTERMVVFLNKEIEIVSNDISEKYKAFNEL